MSKPYAFAALLIIEADDPRLSDEALAKQSSHPTASTTARIRAAVLQHLPKGVRRVVAVMPVDHAKALMLLHDAASELLTGEEQFVRPPPDYIPPTND